MFLALSLLACDKGGDDTADSQATSVFEELIFTTETPVAQDGDLSCYTAGDDWNTSAADPSCVTDVTMGGEVEDFELGDAVDDATLQFFMDDTYVEGDADHETTSDNSGIYSGVPMKTCTPITYAVSTDPDLAETVLTIQAHNIYGFASELDEQLNSVSTDTYNLIPGLLGVNVVPGLGIVAGTIFGCGGDGDPVSGLQVIVSSGGEYPEDQVIKYFRNDFPNRDQLETSADGLFVAINLPVGEATIEAWGWDGSEHVKVGEVTLTIQPDSINIANLFYGYGGESGGLVYPESCTSACSEG